MTATRVQNGAFRGEVVFLPEGEGDVANARDGGELTIVGGEEMVRVIFNGRLGYMKKGDVEVRQAAAEERSKEFKNDDQQAEKRLAAAKVLDLPAFALPDKKPKLPAPAYLARLEEFVNAGFPVPRSFDRRIHDLSEGILAALQRPGGVHIAAALVRWGARQLRLAPQIPPLLPELPREVRAAFRSLAPYFLAQHLEDTGHAAEWMQLFRSCLGLPPSGAGQHALQSRAPLQPYGTAASSATFHPRALLPQDYERVRRKLSGAKTEVESIYDSFRVVEAEGETGTPPMDDNPLDDNSKELVFVGSTEENVRNLCKVMQSPIPLLIEGDTGVGKTASVCAAAERMGSELIRFNLSSGTTVQDLLGRLQIDHEGRLELSLQPFTKAFQQGLLLVLDECNLAQEEVLSTLETAIDTGLLTVTDPSNPARAAKEIVRHPAFRLIITQNPCTGLFAGKRNKLSDAFLSRFQPLRLVGMTRDEVAEIAASKFAQALGGSRLHWRQLGRWVRDMHFAVVDYTKQEDINQSTAVFSVRDIINTVKLLCLHTDSAGSEDFGKRVDAVSERFPETAWCIYGVRFFDAKARDAICDMIANIVATGRSASPFTPASIVARIKAPQALPAVGACVLGGGQFMHAPHTHPLVLTPRMESVWQQIDYVMELGRPVLLLGDTGQGTTATALGYAAHRTGGSFLLSHVTGETTAGALIGQMVPCCSGEDEAAAAGKAPKVTQWIDGPVTTAVEKGRWLVLDDLPSAAATVLERLNSVLEEKPELYVSERIDADKQVAAHPNFRVIATANIGQIASLSPAFANRFNIIVCPSNEETLREELALIVEKLLTHEPEPHVSRAGKHLNHKALDARGVKVEKVKESAYSAAVVGYPLFEQHEWEVKIGGDANGVSVGVCVDDPGLDLDDKLFSSEFIWGYSNHGKVFQRSDRRKSVGASVEEFKAGDVITVTVDIPKFSVKFAKNGKHQSELNLQTQQGRRASTPTPEGENLKGLFRPFVGLYSKGSSAVISAMTGAAAAPAFPEENLDAAVTLCERTVKNRGAYGLATVVRALSCARMLALGGRSSIENVKASIGLIELGEAVQGEAGKGGDDEEAGKLKKGLASFSKRMVGCAGLQAVAALSKLAVRVVPSLVKAQDRARWCRTVRLPLLVMDDYCWGLAGTLMPSAERVVGTAQSTVSEWLGAILPTCTKHGVSIKRVPGPLQRALGVRRGAQKTNGGAIVIENVHTLTGTVQAQLSNLLEYGVLSRDGEGEDEMAMENFYLIASCKSSEAARLSKKFRSQFVQLYLPAPLARDYIARLEEPQEGTAGAENATIAAAAQKMTGNPRLPMDLRIFAQVQRRMQRLAPSEEAVSRPMWWGVCYANMMLQRCTGQDERAVLVAELVQEFVEGGVMAEDAAERFVDLLDEPPSMEQKGENVVFKAGGMKATCRGDVKAHALGATTNVQLLSAIAALAQHAAAEESLVLAGPTSCKTLAVEVYAAIRGTALEPIHMTCSHDVPDLLGAVYPYSQAELAATVEKDETRLAARAKEHADSMDGWQHMLNVMKKTAAAVDPTDAGLTHFALKDGPLTEMVKTGHSILLKAANLPPQELYSALGELLHDHVLPMGLVSPTGRSVPLKPGVPLVLSVTCGASASLPSALAALPVKRCKAYSEADLCDILKRLIGKRHGDDALDALLAKSLIYLLKDAGLKVMLRIAEFTAAYSEIAEVPKHAALVLGRHLLMQIVFSQAERDGLIELGWTPAQVDEVVALLPGDGEVGSSKMGDYLSFDAAKAKLTLKDTTGKMLSVAQVKDPAAFEERLGRTSMVPIPSLLRNLASIFAASTLRMPLLLEGAPGIGKSFIVESTAELVGAAFRRIQFSAGTTIAHLYGAMMPKIVNGVRQFQKKDGALGAALNLAAAHRETEVWILLDELNLAPPEVQQKISELLQPNDAHRNVRIFAAVNPAAIGGGRSHLPPSVKDMFASITLNRLRVAEEVQIAEAKFREALDFEAGSALAGQLLAQLEHMHCKIAEDVRSGELGMERGGGAEALVNLRTLEKVILLLAARLGRDGSGGHPALKLDPEADADAVKVFFLQVLDVVYRWQFPALVDTVQVKRYLEHIAEQLEVELLSHPAIESLGRGEVIMFGQAAALRGSSAAAGPPLPPSGQLQARLAALAAASGSTLAVLLEGPTGSGKTALIRELARIAGQKLRVIPISPTTEVGELLGSWVPWAGVLTGKSEIKRAITEETVRLAAAYVSDPESAGTEAAARVANALAQLMALSDGQEKVGMSLLRECIAELSAALGGTLWGRQVDRMMQLLGDGNHDNAGVSFHFAESQLLHAMRDGEWVLMDNIDWAPPAAVERLNSLLEADPSFVLTERGEDDEAVLRKRRGIHENFRIFFTSNPSRKHAVKLSAAFMNRVVRLVLSPFIDREGALMHFGDLRATLPNVLFFSISPESVDLATWQYLCTVFFRRVKTRDPSVSVRTLRFCVEKWRDDMAAHGQTHSPLFLLCAVLLSTFRYLAKGALNEWDLVTDLRDTLSEAWWLGPGKGEAAEERRRKEEEAQRKREAAKKKAEEEAAKKAAEEKENENEKEKEEKEEEAQAPVPEPEPEPELESESEVDGADDADSISDDDYETSEEEVGGEMVETSNRHLEVPVTVQRDVEACLSAMAAAAKLDKKVATEEEDMPPQVVPDGFDGMDELAKDVAQMWEDKAGGFCEELIQNLVAPPNVNKALRMCALYNHAKAIEAQFPNLTESHIIAMVLYTMEGPDIDRVMGFENVPTWNALSGNNAAWFEYRRRYPRRNVSLYQVLNRNLRMALLGNAGQKIETRSVIKEWVKFLGLLVTMCEQLPGEKTLFRALKGIPPGIIDQYKAASQMAWSSASSCSQRRLNYFMDADKKAGNLMFVVNGVTRGLPLSAVSAYKAEEEVLLPPFITLKVTGVKQTDMGAEIDLRVTQYTFWDCNEFAAFRKALYSDCISSFTRLQVKSGRMATRTMLVPLDRMITFPNTWAAEVLKAAPPTGDGIVYASIGEASSDAMEAPVPNTFAFADDDCGRFKGRTVRAATKGMPTAVRQHFAATEAESATVDALSLLLPNNIFTRMEAASSGVELYIPGLIKAISTNFTYSKVFATKTAGGARSYGSVILFDTEVARGDKASVHAYLQLFLSLRNGLAACDLDPAVVLQMGSAAQCVHTQGGWTDAATFAFLTHLHRATTVDKAGGPQAASLRLAVSLAMELKGKKKTLFFVTNGKGVSHTDCDVASVLALAEARGVDVIGVGMGGSVHAAVPNAISLSAPADLGKGLARFITGPHTEPPAREVLPDQDEQEEVFWGRVHHSLKVSGLSVHNNTTTQGNALLAFSSDIVKVGQTSWTVAVSTEAEVYLGFGTAVLGSAVHIASLKPQMGEVHAVGTGEYTVTVDMEKRKFVLDSGVDGSSTESDLHGGVLEAYLLVAFERPGSCKVVKHVQGGDDNHGWNMLYDGITIGTKRGSTVLNMDFSKGLDNVLIAVSPPVASKSALVKIPKFTTKHNILTAWGVIPADPQSLKGMRSHLEHDMSSFKSKIKPQDTRELRPLGPVDEPVACLISLERGANGSQNDFSLTGLETDPLRVLEEAKVSPVRGPGADDQLVALMMIMVSEEPTHVTETWALPEVMYPFASTVPYPVGLMPPSLVSYGPLMGAPMTYGAHQFTIQALKKEGKGVLRFSHVKKSEADAVPRLTIDVPNAKAFLAEEELPLTGDRAAVTVLVDLAANCIKYKIGGRVVVQSVPPQSVLVPEFGDQNTATSLFTVQKQPVDAALFEDDPGWTKTAKGVTVVDERTVTTGPTRDYSGALRKALGKSLHQWEVLVESTEGRNLLGVVVGVAEPHVNLSAAMSRKRQTWVIAEGAVASHGEDSFATKPFNRSKSVAVRVEVDMAGDRKLKFFVDGEPQSVDFKPIPADVEVCPLVGLFRNQKATFKQHDGGDDGKDGTPGAVEWRWGGFGNKPDHIPDNAVMMTGGGKLGLRLAPTTGAEKKFRNIYGPVVEASGTHSWKYAFSGGVEALNGVSLGAVVHLGDAAPEEGAHTHPYQRDQTFIYTNHGTISHGKNSRLNDPIDQPNSVVTVSLHKQELTFTLRSGNRSSDAPRTQEHKLKVEPADAMLRPMLGWYDAELEVEITGVDGFTPAAAGVIFENGVGSAEESDGLEAAPRQDSMDAGKDFAGSAKQERRGSAKQKRQGSPKQERQDEEAFEVF